jgi:GR25 family glycosyltransferase involved in LPS biosynthesis
VETQIGIVAHTTRAERAKALAAEVKADFVAIDNGTLGCDLNHDLVHQHLSNLPASWSVILEDDAVPVENFRQQLEDALEVSPSPIVSLYLGRLRPPQWQARVEEAVQQAETAQAHWIIGSELLHGVGYAIRTELLPALLRHVSNLPIDQHISEWARLRAGYRIAYTYPSLVDHADIPTVILHHPDGKPRVEGRTAWNAAPHSAWDRTHVHLQPI